MNVLKITTTPIKLSMSSQKARLESHLPEPELGIIRTPSRLNMKSENIKVNIDTSAARDSLGFKTARSLNRDAAVFGKQAAANATVRYAQMGNQMMQIQKGVTIPEIVQNQMMAQTKVTTGFEFLPAVGPDISWDPGSLAIDYTPSRIEFDPQPDMQEAVYVPGELNINVEQYPKVEIEYVGEPMYVPPSASPEYEERDGLS